MKVGALLVVIASVILCAHQAAGTLQLDISLSSSQIAKGPLYIFADFNNTGGGALPGVTVNVTWTPGFLSGNYNASFTGSANCSFAPQNIITTNPYLFCAFGTIPAAVSRKLKIYFNVGNLAQPTFNATITGAYDGGVAPLTPSASAVVPGGGSGSTGTGSSSPGANLRPFSYRNLLAFFY